MENRVSFFREKPCPCARKTASKSPIFQPPSPLIVNIRLVCKGLDVNAKREEKARYICWQIIEFDTITLTELLPQNWMPFSAINFRIDVKCLNREIGYVTWIIQPYAEDWLEKANRIIDDQMKA